MGQRPFFDASRSLLGCLLDTSWGLLGASWGPLGGLLGASWGLVGPLGGLWGPPRGLLGPKARNLNLVFLLWDPYWARPEALLGRLGGLLGCLGAHLGADLE